MVTSNYWVGVVLTYLGFLICIYEVISDPRMVKHSHWVWLFAMGTIFAAITTFSIMVPLARAPFEVLAYIRPGEYPPKTIIGGIEWIPEFTDLRVALSNPTTDTDYEDIDITIEPDEPIVKISQISSVSGVSFIGDVTKEIVEVEGVLVTRPDLTKTNPDGSVTNVPIVQIFTPKYRVRCQTIPKLSSIELVLAISRPAGHKKDARFKEIIYVPIENYSRGNFERTRPTKIRIIGTYKATYRQRKIDETIAIFAPKS